ncbi:jg24700 [Pararge aegeria aegeria]|uniref:Jg24700 protein n=1 Tax=Pararge aegeria aegeria TaxID=348720 RepID=A0A8S4QFI0_9NEOP|nr:jg24700 [Pararge aegeria aegeria]
MSMRRGRFTLVIWATQNTAEEPDPDLGLLSTVIRLQSDSDAVSSIPLLFLPLSKELEFPWAEYESQHAHLTFLSYEGDRKHLEDICMPESSTQCSQRCVESSPVDYGISSFSLWEETRAL